MLASVLPGLRDVRAPLAAGYLWLLAAYIAFEPLAPKHPTSGIWLILAHIDHRLTALGLGIAVSFAAYVLGSLSQVVSQWLPQSRLASWWLVIIVRERYEQWAAQRYRHLPGVPHRGPYGEKGARALWDLSYGRANDLANAVSRVLPGLGEHGPLDDVRDLEARPEGGFHSDSPQVRAIWPMVREALGPVIGSFSPEPSWLSTDNRAELAAANRLRSSIVDELHLARISLLSEEPAIFSEIDRLQSEAEFRRAVAPALVALALAIGWRAEWWTAVPLILMALVLGRSAHGQMIRANDSLLEAVRLERAKVPSLDRFDSAIKAVNHLGTTINDDKASLS